MDKEEYSDNLDSLSRRRFLTGIGTLAAGGVIVSGMLSPKQALAETAAPSEEPEEEKIFDGVELSMGRIVHDPALCAGCRQCEIVCSISKWGVVNPDFSAIRIRTDILGGYVSSAELCKQCPGAECVAICPNDACHVDPETGARVIDREACVGCQLCLYACPIIPSRVHYIPAENVCVKCDLCGGDPKCVAHCPSQALSASWVEKAEDSSIFNTESGIVVKLSLTGAVLVVDKTAVTLANINAIRSSGSVTVSGDISSTYTQPFTAKIKTTYFDGSGEIIFVSERLELEVDIGSTISFKDVYETPAPDQVTRCYLEVMCGKIAG
ncbi:MAG: 4Fe-4S dicluster domain-containing protein [Actinobacteria bacterium]|nr:4Fe-4S dicluster domain-containing protein [Actinomycetota bacterium]